MVTGRDSGTTMLHGRVLVAGEASGEVLACNEPLSFWGGYDPNTGEIIDRRHPLSGEPSAGKILAVPASRGSSTTTAVFLEAVRQGNQPAAILTACDDTFFALASIVADEMYGRPVPIVALSPMDHARLRSGDRAEVGSDGTVTIRR